MYIVIKNKRPLLTSNSYIEREGFITIEREPFTKEEKEDLNIGAIVTEKWEVVKTVQETAPYIRKMIENIKADFDEKISEYLSKYPKREQDTFAEKKREAEKVMDWQSSVYIEWKAEVLWVTPEQFAQKIIAKNNEWMKKYTQFENEKDTKIAKLEKELQHIKK